MAVLTTIPMALMTGPVVGFLVGDFLDRKFATAPWLMVVFSLVGIVSGVRQTWRLIQRAEAEKEPQKAPLESPRGTPSETGNGSDNSDKRVGVQAKDAGGRRRWD